MSKIVVFFSQTGKTKSVAQGIAEKLKIPLAEIQVDRPRNQSLRPLKTKYTEADLPAISCTVNDFSPFSEIILGGPVWAFSITPPLVSFVKHTSLSGKTVHLFVTEFGMGGKRAMRILEHELQQQGARIGARKIFALTVFKKAPLLRLQGERWAEELPS